MIVDKTKEEAPILGINFYFTVAHLLHDGTAGDVKQTVLLQVPQVEDSEEDLYNWVTYRVPYFINIPDITDDLDSDMLAEYAMHEVLKYDRASDSYSLTEFEDVFTRPTFAP